VHRRGGSRRWQTFPCVRAPGMSPPDHRQPEAASLPAGTPSGSRQRSSGAPSASPRGERCGGEGDCGGRPPPPSRCSGEGLLPPGPGRPRPGGRGPRPEPFQGLLHGGDRETLHEGGGGDHHVRGSPHRPLPGEVVPVPERLQQVKGEYQVGSPGRIRGPRVPPMRTCTRQNRPAGPCHGSRPPSPASPLPGMPRPARWRRGFTPWPPTPTIRTSQVSVSLHLLAKWPPTGRSGRRRRTRSRGR